MHLKDVYICKQLRKSASHPAPADYTMPWCRRKLLLCWDRAEFMCQDEKDANVGFTILHHSCSKAIACAKQGHERLGSLPVQTYTKCRIMYSEKTIFHFLQSICCCIRTERDRNVPCYNAEMPKGLNNSSGNTRK